MSTGVPGTYRINSHRPRATGCSGVLSEVLQGELQPPVLEMNKSKGTLPSSYMVTTGYTCDNALPTIDLEQRNADKAFTRSHVGVLLSLGLMLTTVPVAELWDEVESLPRSHRSCAGYAGDCRLAATSLKQRNAHRVLQVPLVTMNYSRDRSICSHSPRAAGDRRNC